MISSRRIQFAGLACALVMTVLGLRWTTIDRFGMDLPEMDQWDAEGLHSLLPWIQDRGFFSELFRPHNEHYVVLTKLLNLGLTVVNGQWDQRLEGVVNAVLPAAIALALLLWAGRFLPTLYLLLFAWLLAAAWGLPLGWENVLGGFHSQQFFLLGLSMATIAWLPLAWPGSLRWWLASGSAALALLSMASGFFAALIVLILVGLRVWRRETTLATAWPTLLIAAVIIAAGWLTRHEVSYHSALKAADLHDFVVAMIRSFQWPASYSRWCGLLLWLPWIWLAFNVVPRSKVATNSLRGPAWILLGLGGWVGLQVLATAYARGAGGPPPALRYLDTLLLGTMVNALSLGWLARERVGRPPMLPVLGLAWFVVVGCGLFQESRQAANHGLPERRAYQKKAIIATRAYVTSGDAAYLDDPDIPYPGANAFEERLAHPELFNLLPASVRPAIHLESADGAQAFAPTLITHPATSATTDSIGPIPGMTKESSASGPPIHRRIWTSASAPNTESAGTWASTPIPAAAQRGYLLFAINGDPHAVLELRSTHSDETIASLHPSLGSRWTTVTARAPRQSFYLHAQVDYSSQGLGFSEPVFMPLLSYASWQLAANGRLISAVGLSAMLLCSFALCLGAWRSARKSTMLAS